MYYPYLRGRQYELLAVRELIENDLISDNVVPIIEPVKETSTLKSTLIKGIEANKKIYTIVNPEVGEFNLYDGDYNVNENLLYKYDAILMNKKNTINIDILKESQNIITLYFSRDSIKNFDILKQNDISSNLNFIKDGNRYSRFFKREGMKIGLIRDPFEKQKRNADYVDNTDEFFSDDHLYFSEEGYSAFSDYSIVGEDYIVGGFAPVAVAMHIVYFDEDNSLRIKHFVSDTNDDISNPAGKFKEALGKLVDWSNGIKEYNESYAITEFRKLWDQKKYPGLGYVKKLSIMHHLEIMNKFLSRR